MEIQKQLVKQHNGKWLKEMGDGALVSFSSALDAVNCSIEIQESVKTKLDAKLRIGIHLGDITIEKNDVYGDGVNVASRLESIADPGGIYISDNVEKSIKGQTNVQAKYLGEIKLKNVAYGVRTYALQGAGLPVPGTNKNKEISGRFLAEVQRRGVIRVAITYLAFSLFLILLLPYVGCDGSFATLVNHCPTCSVGSWASPLQCILPGIMSGVQRVSSAPAHNNPGRIPTKAVRANLLPAISSLYCWL